MSRRVAGVFLLVLLGLSAAPILPRLGEDLLGYETVDHYGTQWFYWFAERQLGLGESPAHTSLFFHPWGKDIYGHTGANLLDAVLAAPFRWALGPTLGYNSFILLALLATGWAFYRFARRFASEGSALAAAGLFSCAPYVLYEVLDGRPTQGILLFPVLFLDALWRTASADRRAGRLAAAEAGLWLALCGYQYWFYALFGGLLTIGHALGVAWEGAGAPGPAGATLPGATTTERLLRYVGVGVVSVLLCVPVAWPLLQASASGETTGLLLVEGWSSTRMPLLTEEGKQVGLGVWQVLTGRAGLWQQGSDGIERFLPTLTPIPAFWVVALLVWLRAPGRLSRGPMLGALLVLALLGTGPAVVVLGQLVPNPLYLGMLHVLSFFRRLWWPARVLAFVTPLLYLTLAVALDRVAAWTPRWGEKASATSGRRWSSWLSLLSGGGLALLSLLLAAAAQLHGLRQVQLLPIPTWNAAIPAGYRCLASGPAGALIELPWAWSQAHLYFQTGHGRPILGGMVEDDPTFAPVELGMLRSQNTFLRRLAALAQLGGPSGGAPQDTAADLDLPVTEADKAQLHTLGYRYVVLQRDAYARAPGASRGERAAHETSLRRLNRAFDGLLGRNVYEDARVTIWAPWGDPPPCMGSTPAPDTVPMLRDDLDPVTRAGTDRETSGVTWFFARSSASGW